MVTIDYFKNLRTIPMQIKSKLELIKLNADLLNYFNYRGSNKSTEAAEKLRNSIQRLKNETSTLADYRLDLEDIINDLPHNHKTVLTLRFVSGFGWAKVSEIMGYSIPYCKIELIQSALKYVEKNNLLNVIKDRYGGAL